MIFKQFLLWGLHLACFCVATPGIFIKSNPIFDLINIEKSRMIIKNELLRWRISREVMRNKHRSLVVKRFHTRNLSKLCNQACSSYYTHLCNYYSISDEDKYLIEFIISAIY